MNTRLTGALYGSGRERWLEGLALLLFTACSWGLNWPIMKFLLTELPPFTMRSISGGLGLVIAIFWPNKRLNKVDLPTLGRPITATKPLRWSLGSCSDSSRFG